MQISHHPSAVCAAALFLQEKTYAPEGSHGRRKAFPTINYLQMSFFSFTNCPYKTDLSGTAVKETKVT